MHGPDDDMPLLISGLIAHADRTTATRKSCRRPWTEACIAIPTRDAHARARSSPTRCNASASSRASGSRRSPGTATGISNLLRGRGLRGGDPHDQSALFPDQITYIANHAEDQYVFFDLSFAPLLEKLAPLLKTVKGYVVMCARDALPKGNIPHLLC